MINKALYFKELKRNRKHFVIWTLIVVFLTLFIMGFYPNFEGMGKTMEKMMEGLPNGMMRAFGMDLSVFQNVLTYYGLYYGLHIMILSGVFTIVLSAGIVSKEEQQGTADFLLARPIWRSEVLTGKLAAFSTYFLLYFLIQTVTAILGFEFIARETVDWHKFAVLTGYGVMLNFCFGGLGFLLSVLPRRGRSTTAPAIAIVVGSFIVQALSRISPETEWIGWITPFQYANFQIIPYDYGFTWWRVLVLVGIGIVSVTGAYRIYLRKDIYT